MEQRQPIFWYQGLFLQPQHFQQNDLYYQSLLRHSQGHIQPHYWGVCTMEVLESALNNRIFEISAGEFLFPDGALAAFPENAILQSRSFKGVWPEEKPFDIYLGLRKWRPEGENVAVLKDGDTPTDADVRFIAYANPREIRDVYYSGPPAGVKFLRYYLKVFWESEIEGAGDYDLIHVARLEREMDNIRLSRIFVPPAVSVCGSKILLQTMQNIREQVTARCHMLEEYKLPRETQFSDIGWNFITYLLALRSLNRYVPLLHHLTESGAQIHPWHAYGLLRQIIGELSAFSERVDALGRTKDGTPLLPDYDHNNLGGCFYEAWTLIGELLNEITLGAENIIHLERSDGSFKAPIPLSAFDSRNAFYLVIGTSMDQQEVLRMFQHTAKVSSEERMPTLIQRALPGIPLEKGETPIPGLPQRAGTVFFRIDRSSNDWLEIQKAQSICVQWNEASEDSTIDLVIVRK
jgi:type VI secretion system protein ImpJ